MSAEAALADTKQASDIGDSIYALIEKLFPIHRSTTGEGVRSTLRIIQEMVPLVMHEVPTGTQVLDWVVPKEWNIRDAYVKDASGRRVIDYGASNLHVVNTSVPVNRKMTLEELKQHLHTIPEHPEWIPYRYSHYNEGWGFCIAYKDYVNLDEGEYEVCIESSLEDGFLTYGECYLPGKTQEEVLISCHVCHPSLANDNLSGISIAAHLARDLARQERRYSYRFIFVPSTIGAITWLARNEDAVERIRHGVVLSCLGDPGHSTYKRSRQGNAIIDRAVTHVLEHSGAEFSIREFAPYGYDERQFNSPGFNLPVGLFMRTPHDCYPQYHTSGDNLDLVRPEALADSYRKLRYALDIVESADKRYVATVQKGEAQLGRRGLYRPLSGQADQRVDELPLLWVMNFSDGEHGLLDIAERSGIEFRRIERAAQALDDAGLLVDAEKTQAEG